MGNRYRNGAKQCTWDLGGKGQKEGPTDGVWKWSPVPPAGQGRLQTDLIEGGLWQEVCQAPVASSTALVNYPLQQSEPTHIPVINGLWQRNDPKEDEKT